MVRKMTAMLMVTALPLASVHAQGLINGIQGRINGGKPILAAPIDVNAALKNAMAIKGVNESFAISSGNYQTSVNAQKDQNIAAINADASKNIAQSQANAKASIAQSLANPHLTLTRDASLGQVLDDVARGLGLARVAKNLNTVNISPTVLLGELGQKAMQTNADKSIAQTNADAAVNIAQTNADAAVKVSKNTPSVAPQVQGLPKGSAQIFPSGNVIPGFAH